MARIGESEGILEAYEESDNGDERVFKALAVLVANLGKFETYEHQLRLDLAVRSDGFAIEAQADIIDILRGIGTKRAVELADAWRPFYRKGDVSVILN